MPPEHFERALDAVKATGVSLTLIGSARDGVGAILRAPDGTEHEARGFDQLRSSN